VTLLKDKYVPQGNMVLATAAVLLLGLSAAFILISARVLKRGDELG
jgi:hypothetical protein